MAVDWIRQHASTLDGPDSCVDLIQNLDRAVAQDKVAGETTCVVVVVTVDEIFGASVGDSGAWLIDSSGYVDLTRQQVRKPFVGSGSARPIHFSHKLTNGRRLLLATDGLFKYSSSERITAICRHGSPDEVAKQLIESVRYPSGSLPDDVTVIFGEL
jgi:serine/threonine protein phosphatase PrpC